MTRPERVVPPSRRSRSTRPSGTLQRGGGPSAALVELADALGRLLTTILQAKEHLPVNALHPTTFRNTKMVLESVGYATSTFEDGFEATLRLAVAPEFEGMTAGTSTGS
jgi:hypothetical protein